MKKITALLMGLAAVLIMLPTQIQTAQAATPTFTLASKEGYWVDPVTVYAAGITPGKDVIVSKYGKEMGRATASSTGTATIVMQPSPEKGWLQTSEPLVVRDTSTGVSSPYQSYRIKSATSTITAKDAVQGSPVKLKAGVPATITIQGLLPNIPADVEVRSLDGTSSTNAGTFPVGSDGIATVAWTPTEKHIGYTLATIVTQNGSNASSNMSIFSITGGAIGVTPVKGTTVQVEGTNFPGNTSLDVTFSDGTTKNVTTDTTGGFTFTTTITTAKGGQFTVAAPGFMAGRTFFNAYPNAVTATADNKQNITATLKDWPSYEKVTISVAGQTKTVDTGLYGKATATFTGIPAGTYTVTANKAAGNSVDVTVYVPTLKITNTTYTGEATLTGTGFPANTTVTVRGNQYRTNTNGELAATLTGLAAGQTTISVDEWPSATTTARIYRPTLGVQGANLTLTVKGAGFPANTNLTLNVSGQTVNVTTDNEGNFTYTTPKAEGEYTITVGGITETVKVEKTPPVELNVTWPDNQTVGILTRVTGTVTGAAETSLQAFIGGRWVTVASHTGELFSYQLTTRITYTGEQQFRIIASNGTDTKTVEHTVTRLPWRVSSAGRKPTGHDTYLWGTMPAAAGRTVASQVWVNGQWVTSQTATGSMSSFTAVKQTYGTTTSGTYRFRMVASTPYGWVASEPVTLERYPYQVGHAGSKPVRQATFTWACNTSTPNRYVETQIYYRGGWVRSQAGRTDSRGCFTLPLTYGRNTPGTYQYRTVLSTRYGWAVSQPFTLRRY